MKDLMNDKCLCCKTNERKESYLCDNCKDFFIKELENKLALLDEQMDDVKEDIEMWKSTHKNN